jgi:AcrR family transcriptional regulator
MSVPATKRTYMSSEQRREQILACALEVFAAKGFHAASIGDICARAKIGRATLYQYFKDKRDVLVALADQIAKRVIDAVAGWAPVPTLPNRPPTVEDAFKWTEERYAQILAIVFADTATARLVLRAGRGADGVVDETLRMIDDRVVGLIEGGLREGIAAGVIRPCDTRVVAGLIVGGIEKIILDALERDRPIDIAHVAREAAMLQCHGSLRHLEPPDEAKSGGRNAQDGSETS